MIDAELTQVERIKAIFCSKKNQSGHVRSGDRFSISPVFTSIESLLMFFFSLSSVMNGQGF